jgi:hypothetical protein
MCSMIRVKTTRHLCRLQRTACVRVTIRLSTNLRGSFSLCPSNSATFRVRGTENYHRPGIKIKVYQQVFLNMSDIKVHENLEILSAYTQKDKRTEGMIEKFLISTQ